MLARAVGPQVEKDIKALLDQMFSVGLSSDLTSALKVIAQEVPQLQRDIQGDAERNHDTTWCMLQAFEYSSSFINHSRFIYLYTTLRLAVTSGYDVMP